MMNRAVPWDITKVARRAGLKRSEIESRGRTQAKVELSVLERLPAGGGPRRSRYILVSAITPTPLGEGKTVTTIALSMALNRLGSKAAATLRQASMGPLFGAKGMGTGGGASQVIPAEEVSLHFTGDLPAVEAANNLLVSFLENSLFHGNPLDIDPDSILARRCMDLSDRAMRNIRYFLRVGGERREMATGFEITAASEVMSLLTLSRDRADMRRRLSDIVVARRRNGEFVRARDLKADGVMAVILKEAIKPNLVQTSENTPCFIHTGPFANVSVGASSIIADRIALGLFDHVVTESGFGVDCGAEKFFDIKCRASALKPDACVLVCSVRGLKAQSPYFHVVPGEAMDPRIFEENLEALEAGSVNLKKHLENVRRFGVPVVVSVNVFPTDTEREVRWLVERAKSLGAADAVACRAYEEGSRGALELARSLVRAMKNQENTFRMLYREDASLKDKIIEVATKIYGAASVDFSPQAQAGLEVYERSGFGRLPVCIAKTQFSLSHDETLKGAPQGFVFPVKDVRICGGAGFVLAHASLMQTMPGLPAKPRGNKADLDAAGKVTGLS